MSESVPTQVGNADRLSYGTQMVVTQGISVKRVCRCPRLETAMPPPTKRHSDFHPQQKRRDFGVEDNFIL
ncbi:MAG TPA: hypothetical protein VFI72_11025 [Candidatus Angelobacter sp.]|nr:hypothetical protein [Candidatus Angelobacter sp.]